MEFILGLIAGLVVATLIVVTITFFKSPILHTARTVGTAISNAGPRPKGMVYMPPDEADEAREEIIEENKKKGLNTTIDELQ